MKQLLFFAGLVGLPGLAQAQSFAPVAFYSTQAGTQPAGLAVGDVNGDGYLDIVTSTNGGNYADAVLLNQQNGTFAPAVFYSTGPNTNSRTAALSDVNRDGYLDIITPDYVQKSVCVLLNQQNNGFAAPANYSTGTGSYPDGLTVADVNLDSYPDVVVANSLTGGAVGVLLNQQNGTFAPVASYPAGIGSPFSIASADLNQDGYPDLVVGIYTSSNNGAVGVLLNQQNGTFGAVATYGLAGPNGAPYSLSVGDVNGDTYPDVVTSNGTSGTVRVLLNQQNGTLGAGVAYSGGGGAILSGVTLGDVNGDGRADMVVANGQNGTVSVLLNQQNGTFGVAATYPAGSSPYNVVVRDVNRDGRPDIIVSNPGLNAVGVLLNTGTFTPLSSSSGQPLASISLWPNPTQATATVVVPALAGASQAQLTLCDVLGRPVRGWSAALPAAGLRQPLDVRGLAPGTYLLRVQAGEAQATRRLQVE